MTWNRMLESGRYVLEDYGMVFLVLSKKYFRYECVFGAEYLYFLSEWKWIFVILVHQS